MNLLLGAQESPITEIPLELLTTHFVAFGATGSGKTGFITVLIEELAHAGVSVLAVDVKGDLANLALRDPNWEKRALSENISCRMLDAAVYTPGSCDCRPLRLLSGSSKDPISASWLAEAILSQTALKGDRAARALLTRLLLDAEGLSLAELAQLVSKPPASTLAKLPFKDLLPESRRKRLASELASLSADPVIRCFEAGEPLNPEAGPPIKVIYLAHLPEILRMLATSLLLSEVYRWAVSRGSGKLKLAIAFDEVRGYLPPYPRSPPSKPPLEALIRQGRGFGVSVLLATQNPRDIDYRLLSNVGLWVVGLLRAKQDRRAVAEALSDVFGVSKGEIEATVAKLRQREFLLLSTHLEPTIMKVRHTLTPLRGPLSLDALKGICASPSEGPEESLPQYTIEGAGAAAYRPWILARGIAVYRPPWLWRGIRREFTVLIDPQSLTVVPLSGSLPMRLGAPPEAGRPPTLPEVEDLLKHKLAEKFCSAKGAKQKLGESAEEFKARIAAELEERKRKVSEKYEAQLRKLIKEVERSRKSRRKLSGDLVFVLIRAMKNASSRRFSSRSVARGLKKWMEARERITQLKEEEGRLETEAKELMRRWTEELELLERKYKVSEVVVRPEIQELSLAILWAPQQIQASQWLSFVDEDRSSGLMHSI